MLNKINNIKWLISKGLTEYQQSISVMKRICAELKLDKNQPEIVWLVEHPPLYTSGISDSTNDILDPETPLPIYKTQRGGKMTYHGPGQRIIYLMMDLRKHGFKVRQFVRFLEDWIIHSLAQCGVAAQRNEGSIGVWVGNNKIAAIGLQLSGGITSHGIAINIDPDLERFNAIVPCGILDKGVASLASLGFKQPMNEFDKILQTSFAEIFQIPLASLQNQHFDPQSTRYF